MNHTRTNLLPKLWAVLAIALMLHAQAAWACANAGVVHDEPPSCCAEHSPMASDRMAECGDLSSEALCAKPFAHSASLALSQTHEDSHDDGLDADDDGGGGSSTPVALLARYPTFTDTHRAPRINIPCETLAPARFTYLKTLRLRI